MFNQEQIPRVKIRCECDCVGIAVVVKLLEVEGVFGSELCGHMIEQNMDKLYETILEKISTENKVFFFCWAKKLICYFNHQSE